MCRPTDKSNVIRTPHKRSWKRPERRGVIVNFFRRQKNLQIADQMAEYETEQDKTGGRHNRFLANSRLPESQTACGKNGTGSTHGTNGSCSLPSISPLKE